MRSLQSTVADVRAWVESTETGAWLLAQMEGIAAALRSFEEAVVPLPLWVFALLAAVALFGLAGMVRARRRRHAAVRRNAISPYEVLSAYGAPPADANPSDMPPSDSARAAIVAGWITLLLFFGGFGTWAATAPLNGAVMGEAVLKVEGNRKSVQHLDGGIVSEIKVREGDRVNAGEILMLLNDSQARAEYDVLVQQHATLRTTEARLLAEFNASPDIVFPQDLLDSGEAYVRTAIDGQRDEFRSRRQAIEGKQVVLRQRAAQLYEQNIGNEARLKAQRSQLVSVEAELETMVDLLERGLVTRPRVLQLERAATSLEADIAGTQGLDRLQPAGIGGDFRADRPIPEGIHGRGHGRPARSPIEAERCRAAAAKRDRLAGTQCNSCPLFGNRHRAGRFFDRRRGPAGRTHIEYRSRRNVAHRRSADRR
jgi:multidrug efflux pump subunit AcrA (membrane-fusion protein)